MKHKIAAVDADKNQLFITIRLDDECHNGHADFAITANIYEAGKPRTDRYLIAGGSCHEDILDARPDLGIFVDLHLSDTQGVPMYAVENGYYHLRNGFNSTPADDPKFSAEFCQYYRVTPEQFDALNACGSKTHYALLLQTLGILDQWKLQAAEGIRQLEAMTGETFVDTSIRSNYQPLTPEQIADETAKIESGFYSSKAIADRNAENERAEIEKARKSLQDAYEKDVEKARNEYEIKTEVLAIGGSDALKNCIIYTHTKELTFNWQNYAKQIPQDVIDRISAQITLPEGFTIAPHKEILRRLYDRRH